MPIETIDIADRVNAGARPQPPDCKDMSQIDRRQPKVTISQIDATSGHQNNTGGNNRLVTVAIEVEEVATPTGQTAQPAASGARDVRLFRNGSLVKAWRGDVFSLDESQGCEKVLSHANGRRVRCKVRVAIVAGANEFIAYASQAVIGTYGKAIPGNRMMGRLPKFEQRGVVQQLDRIRRIETVHRQGQGSGNDFFSLFGSRQAWQVVDIGAKVSGGRQQEVSFEIVGIRLEQSDVINALNADALNYYDYLQQKGEPPCVVLEKVLLTSYNAAQTTNVGVGVNAQTVVTTERAKAQLQNERMSATQLVSPVVRCYQMYEAKLNQNRVVELVHLDP